MQNTSMSLYTHNTDCIMSFTYPTVISDVDISSLVNKIRHYVVTAIHSCKVQGSVLLKRKQYLPQNNRILLRTCLQT